MNDDRDEACLYGHRQWRMVKHRTMMDGGEAEAAEKMDVEVASEYL